MVCISSIKLLLKIPPSVGFFVEAALLLESMHACILSGLTIKSLYSKTTIIITRLETLQEKWDLLFVGKDEIR